MNTNWAYLNNRNLFCRSSGDQKSELKVSEGLSSLWRLKGTILHCLFQPLVAIGVSWLVAASLCAPSLHCLLFCASQNPLCLPLMMNDVCDCI